ncbi:phage baseplate assembly protein V [uncultured Lacinutrix sp.]|uniref:type VI secretion system Vgr family protein n=1 Tax=uncultured Lacinutrix sp. TaxID=574032 RepID=UPI00260C8306|nr:phage baseplate assembly protein V [uncultured Lacinutrix sp.]
MAILSTTHIHINGNELPYYNSCSLHQEIGQHHTMDLHCLLETIQRFCKDNSQEIEDLLGSIITIETKSYADIDFHGMLKFKGIITGLSYRKGMYSSEGDYVIIKAKSPTIIADDGPHYTSYNDMSFVDIIEQNFSNYDTSKLKINTSNSKLSEPLTYTVQSNESCFSFAQRMAARHGEWLYYNGEELVFGIESGGEELDLILGRDLQDFNTSLTPIPQNFDYYANDYLTNDVHETSSSSTASSSEGNFSVVNDNSNEIYTNPTKIWVNLSDDSNSKNRLDNYAELQQKALQTNQVKVSGSSDNPGVMLASVIKINQSSYRVTKVTHSYSNNGEYENFFEANSTNIDAYPLTDLNAFPVAKSQMAKVIENHDPDGLGRVKVQLPWQKADGLTTPWIRNISPSASSGQGLFFIPEVDDEVLVDFEGANAEAPFVLGSTYNSDAKPPGGSANESNHIKMFQSRSGSFLKLNDEDGSITLQDKSGSSIVLDGSGNITITAGETLTVTAGKEMKTTSAEDTTIISGKKATISSEDTATLVSSKDTVVEGTTGVTVKDGVKVDISAPNVTAKGDIGLKMEGTTVDIKGTAMTNVKGAIVNLN